MADAGRPDTLVLVVDAAMRHIEFLDSEIGAVEKLIAQQALRCPGLRSAG